MKTIILPRSVVLAVVLFVVVSLAGSIHANAQASKYQRPGKKASAPVAPVAGAPVSEAKKDAKGEKVDIQQIEQEYWQQKDTEFHVVQNRKFAKEKRAFISAGYSVLTNDSFNRGGAIDLSGGYFFNEQNGVELSYSMFDADDSQTTKEIFGLGGHPTYARPISQIAATYNWMPIYGKISLLDKAIIYFDMGVRVGLGMAEYEREVLASQGGDQKDSSIMYVLDITQQFFIDERWAIRFDVKNRFYSQDLRKENDATVTKSDFEHSVAAELGLIFYFNDTDFNWLKFGSKK